jgi:hypothetical protein
MIDRTARAATIEEGRKGVLMLAMNGNSALRRGSLGQLPGAALGYVVLNNGLRVIRSSDEVR